jgi:hypothetical protein
MKKILILGHGPNPKPEISGAQITTLDMVKYPSIDVKWNLENIPLPFNRNKFDEILLSHVLEHISKEKYSGLMKELHRITKDKGIVKIYVPFFSFFTAFHPDHKNTFTYTSFNKFEPEHPMNKEKGIAFRIKRKRINFGINRQTRIFNSILNPLINTFPLLYCRFFCWILPSEELQFELEVIK